MEKEKPKVIGNPNDWHIEVCPRRAGDFSGVSISSIKYSTKEAVCVADNMIADIERHVERVHSASMVYDSWLCAECGNQFNNKQEAENCDYK